MTDFHFIRPHWLLALIPCIILIVLAFRHRLGRGSWAAVCDEALLPFILQQKPAAKSRTLLMSTAIAAVLSILALAGPTWQRLPVPVFRNDSGLVIVLDLSRSMLAADIKPSRLIRARYKIADILKQRKDGQTALIAYAGDAFTVTPLTEDNETIMTQLNSLHPDIMPVAGANAARALELAKELFIHAGLRKGHILLVTDEVDVDETLPEIEGLGSYKLSVLAVGTEEGAPIKEDSGGFLKDGQGNIVIPKLSLSDLQRVANAGNGKLLQIQDDDSDIKRLLKAVDNAVENAGDNPQEDMLLEQWDDMGAWLLLLVLPLVALNFRRGFLGLVFLFVLPLPKNAHAFEWQDLWQNRNQQGQKAFEQQDYAKAAERFDDPSWKAAAQYKAGDYDKVLETLKDVNTADSFYNQGNALAKSDKLAEAVEAYKKALELNPDDEDVKHNKELVEKELEKQKQQQEQQKQQQDSKQDQQEQEQDSSQNDEQENGSDSKESQSSESENKQDDNQQESSESQEQEQQKAEQQQDAKENKEESQQAEAGEAEEKDSEEQQEAKAQQVSDEQKPLDEDEQARKQWLQSIPDNDPADLLKRKFRQQYGQRKRRQDKNEKTW